jgi:D-alanine-D-alanine ligase
MMKQLIKEAREKGLSVRDGDRAYCIIDTDTDKVYVNEINTIPGSLSFYLWEKTSMSYTDLLDKLISLAFRRNRNRENLTFTIDTNILSGVSFGTKGAKGSKM